MLCRKFKADHSESRRGVESNNEAREMAARVLKRNQQVTDFLFEQVSSVIGR